MIVPDIGNPFFRWWFAGRDAAQKQGYNCCFAIATIRWTRRESYRAAFVEAGGRNFVDEGGGRFPAALRR